MAAGSRSVSNGRLLAQIDEMGAALRERGALGRTCTRENADWEHVIDRYGRFSTLRRLRVMSGAQETAAIHQMTPTLSTATRF